MYQPEEHDTGKGTSLFLCLRCALRCLPHAPLRAALLRCMPPAFLWPYSRQALPKWRAACFFAAAASLGGGGLKLRRHRLPAPPPGRAGAKKSALPRRYSLYRCICWRRAAAAALPRLLFNARFRRTPLPAPACRAALSPFLC